MQTFTEEQVDQMLKCSGTLEHDNHGQLLIYTGVFQWADGSYHDEPDPNLPDDESEA